MIMAIIARHLKEQGRLTKNLVVATVMSNLGFRKSLAEADIEMVETAVGDRYVMEALTRTQGSPGWGAIGPHNLHRPGPTGDGLLTAVRLLNVVAGTGKELRQLRAEAITEYPQVLVNVQVARGVDLADMEPLGARWPP